MVAPVDNLSRLEGVLRRRQPHPTMAGYELVHLDVQATAPVDGRAHLLGSRQGCAVELAVPSRLVGQAAAGDHVVCRARLTGRGLVVAAHPEAEAFLVRRG